MIELKFLLKTKKLDDAYRLASSGLEISELSILKDMAECDVEEISNLAGGLTKNDIKTMSDEMLTMVDAAQSATINNLDLKVQRNVLTSYMKLKKHFCETD